MKKQYILYEYGYVPVPLEDSLTEQEALKIFREIVETSFKDAKRWSKTAFKHKVSNTNYFITANSSKSSPLWQAFTLKVL